MHSLMLPITNFKVLNAPYHTILDELRSSNAASLLSSMGTSLQRNSSNESLTVESSHTRQSSSGSALSPRDSTTGKKRRMQHEDESPQRASPAATISHKKRGKMDSPSQHTRVTSDVSGNLLNTTNASSKTKCRLKVDKKYIRLVKHVTDYSFKLTPFTMISEDNLHEDIIAIFNVQHTVHSCLSYNKTLLIRVNASAAEELRIAVKENVIALVLQMFHKRYGKQVGKRTSEDDENLPSDSESQTPAHTKGFLIRTNILQTTPQNVIYQKPSLLYGHLRGTELMFYKSQDMAAIADVVACRVDWREENVHVHSMTGNPLGIELLVNHEIREQFIAPTEEERSVWLQRFREVIEMNVRRSQSGTSRRSQSMSSVPSVSMPAGGTNSEADSDDDEVLSTIEPNAYQDDASTSSMVELGSQRSIGSAVFNDGDTTGSAPSTTKRSLSLGEEPDFFGDSVNSGDQNVKKSTAGSSLFSADFWNDKKRQRSSSSTNAASLIENLQTSLQQKDDEVRQLRAQLAQLTQHMKAQSVGSQQSMHGEESENEEPDFF